MRLFWRNPSKDFTTAQVHKHVNDAGITISRASIINFLDYMEGLGYLTYIYESCKGGSRRVYHAANVSEVNFRASLASTLFDHIRMELLEES